jgi:LysR family transcriptional regulator, nod-box dependent transcriptional activator
VGNTDLHRLDLNLLVALDALLAERSITRAGARLHLSPSATSGALARLRVYFKDELLRQVGRRMVPTPLGESLQASVRDCLLHVQATVEIRPQFDPAVSTRKFSLMTSDYVATVLMPRVLQRLQTEAPGVILELLGNGDAPWAALDRGDIDFLVIPRNFALGGHPSETLFEDEFVCVCWTGNTVVGDTLTRERFLEMSHVVARIGTERPPTIDAWFFEKFGHVRRVGAVTMNFTSVPQLLIGTNMIALMHGQLARLFERQLPLRILPSPFAMPRLVEVIQWHKYRDKDPGRIWLHQLLRSAAPQFQNSGG